MKSTLLLLILPCLMIVLGIVFIGCGHKQRGKNDHS